MSPWLVGSHVLLVPWTILAAWGLWTALHRHPPLGLVLLAMWVAYPLIYYFVQVDTRYKYPIDWSATLLSVYVLAKGLETRRICDAKLGWPVQIVDDDLSENHVEAMNLKHFG